MNDHFKESESTKHYEREIQDIQKFCECEGLENEKLESELIDKANFLATSKVK